MNTTETIKRYTVKHEWHDHTVTLEVDHASLTAENAALYLSFWTGGDDFACDENDDPVRGLVRFFGAVAIREMLARYGVNFGQSDAVGRAIAETWSRQVRDEEGFGGENETPFGHIGIRILAADVESTSFDDVALEEAGE